MPPRDLTDIHAFVPDAAQSLVAGPPSREAASGQLVVGDIPREAPGFQPRLDLLAELDRVGQGTQVLTGMQGVGSTQLAAAYARAKQAAGWRLVAWVNADNTGNLLAGLAAVADAAGLSDSGTGRDEADTGRAVRRWLETDGDRRLLVFDDVEDPDVLRPFVPADARVLITSIRQQSANLGASLSVDVFNADEALAFLARRTGLADAEGAAAVAAELGHLPLALAQAAAVIAGQRLAYGAYLDRLRELPLQEHPTREEVQASPHSVAGAVLLSLQAVRAADRAGVCICAMEIIAVLSAAGVSRELLHVAGQAGLLASGGHPVPAALVDRALEWLSDRSLLTFSLDGQTIIMHRLAAQVVRDGLARRQRLAAVCRVAASVLDAHATALVRSQARPAVRGIPQQVTALLDNTTGLAGAADKRLARILLRLRFIALYHLVKLGDSTPQAIAFGEPLTADLERLLGSGHPDTLDSRNNLAAAYLAAGRATEAIPLFEQTLAQRQRALGPDHPGTLTSRNNLAAAYLAAGRATEAIPLYELNLAARERLLGVGHPSTLNSRGNLATAYRDGGRVAEAIPLFERTLAGRERVLGPDHPDTQTSRKNLATAYRDGGRVAEAIPLFEQTSAGRERVLGPDHPDTQTSPKDLPHAYRDGRRVAEAIPPVEETLAAGESQPSADAAGQVLPVSFGRSPADPARRVLPVGFSWLPADAARQRLPDSVARPSAKLTDHSSPGRAQDPPPIRAQHDREVVAAIAAGDPAGIAMAYDRYAAALYSYCHWMLHDPAHAAGAMRDTFVIAAATLGDLPEAPELRPWLYAVARNECQRLLRTTAWVRGKHAYPQDLTASVGGHSGQAELRTLICDILAELKPHEREVIELSFRHDLSDSDLAKALGMSWSRAHAVASRGRGLLEKALSTLLIALTGREACPVLGELLADWDGKLTKHTRDLVGWHIEQCPTCATHGRGALRAGALSGLLPLASLPPELREQVLSRCSSITEDAVAYRQQVVRRAESIGFAWFSRAIRLVSGDSIRANPGAAIAAVAVAVWVVAAVTVTLLTFAGSHAQAQVRRPSAESSSSSATAAATTATAPTSAAVRLSPTASQRPAYVPSPVQPSPSSSPSPKPSVSPSPSRTVSPSPSRTVSPSPSRTVSPSPSRTASSAASRSSSPSLSATA